MNTFMPARALYKTHEGWVMDGIVERDGEGKPKQYVVFMDQPRMKAGAVMKEPTYDPPTIPKREFRLSHINLEGWDKELVCYYKEI